MSKAGVAKTQEFRKPRKRKKVTLEERVIDGVLVVGKECTKCGEWKPLESGFSNKRKGIGGKYSICKECVRKKNSKYYEENKEKLRVQMHKYYEENKEKKIVQMHKYYEENKEKKLARNSKYYEENREKIIAQKRKWREENKDKVAVHKQRYRARKKALPATWTVEQKEEMMEYFDRKCALTGEVDITEEHAIPLSIGHGGTIHGNMWPLCSRLNSSKYNKNIFEWFEANRQRFELPQAKFDRLIKWLASANEMTVEEYRDYVYWCHANPNDVLESEAI
ncbi:hypothetical protein COK46_01580 [Bacillus thuringiensis]|uniref:hypothetical protein n=1 Tax=Bacillus thuringiensis TaxID=1428 RepID=UPI000BF544DD|nr:hypothetical protein [Bacillus thuringiensis]PFS24332.1 hypothetical protein COK46_01580 [Bacillus thuringiensis]